MLLPAESKSAEYKIYILFKDKKFSSSNFPLLHNSLFKIRFSIVLWCSFISIIPHEFTECQELPESLNTKISKTWFQLFREIFIYKFSIYKRTYSAKFQRVFSWSKESKKKMNVIVSYCRSAYCTPAKGVSSLALGCFRPYFLKL